MDRMFSLSEVTVCSLLPDSRTPLLRWFCSGCVHIIFISALILIPSALHETRGTPPRVSQVTLYSPAPFKPLPAVRLNEPQPLPRRTVRAPLPVHAALRKPVNATARTQVAARVVETKKVEIATLKPPTLEMPAPAAAASLPVARVAPLPPVKVGGFGDANGAAAKNGPQTQSLTAARIGAFDRPAGAGNESGPVSGKGVAMAGFGSGYGSTNGNGAGGRGSVVRNTGFEGTEGGPQVSKVTAPQAPVETPVSVIWKPKPAYTEEARAKKIEGDVQLEVVFGANGQISILRLLRGLGYGLDESARAAASQIRFRPCMRDGNPIDTKATVHILFALS
jgi:TonB family protein